MSLLYLLGPGIPSWTLTSRHWFTYHSNVSETLAHCIPGSYTIANYLTHTHILCIPQYDSHKDLGLNLSEDVYWDKHYKPITACAYKMLGLILLHFSLLLFNFHNG